MTFKGMLRWAGAILIGLSVCTGAAVVITRPEWGNKLLQSLIEISRSAGGFSWAVLVSSQMLVIVSGFLPAAALGVGAGAIYGVWLGFLIAAIGTLGGATLAFFLARSVFRPLVHRFMSGRPLLIRMDQLVTRDGWKTVFLLRMSPVLPFAATSYGFGLTSIGFRSYLFGTLGALPSLLGYVVLGVLARASVHAWTEGVELLQITLLVGGILATALLVLNISRMARRFSGSDDLTLPPAADVATES
jgi:uncharacterized membrane protein YdjX (TVP38/TMEM64 family)